MSNNDDLIAAIFTASLCAGKVTDPDEYLEKFDQFKSLLKRRSEREMQDRISNANRFMTPR
jgi:hypothetical protein